MADISKITLPNGSSYDIKDTTARSGLAGKAAAKHNHTKSDITDFPTVLTGGSQTTTSTADGGSNVFTFNKSDGTTATITVKNGSKGSTGATGATGPKGDTGASGTSAAWFTGTAVTGTSTSAVSASVSGSKAGDMYLNTSTSNVYRASAANSWVYVCNIKGANGTNATTTATATQSANGLMSAADKKKLDGVAAGATANVGTITGIKMNGANKGTSGVVDLGTVLTAHQSLSGYVPTSRTVNGKALSSNISLTASDVGAAASSHTHTKSQISDFPSSLPANGGNADTVDGKHASDFLSANGDQTFSGTKTYNNTIIVNPTGEGNWREGIRINRANNGWSGIYLGCEQGSTAGTTPTQWSIGTDPNSNLFITYNGSQSSNTPFLMSNISNGVWGMTKGLRIESPANSSGYVEFDVDNEGGNIRFGGKDGRAVEIDCYDNVNVRMYSWYGEILRSVFNYNVQTDTFSVGNLSCGSIGGTINADTTDGYHIATGTGSASGGAGTIYFQYS